LKKINFIDVNKQYELHKDEIDISMANVLNHGAFIQGPEVKELEQLLSEYTGSNALTVANGTDALFISLMALGIGPGDEVITPSFTWVSTVEAIRLVGAKPVYIEVRPETFNINEDDIKKMITPRTKVIMPVSIFGRCPNLNIIKNLPEVKNNDIKILEDAAQSFGAKSDGLMSCSVADISTTSFFPAKPLGCYGDGGAIFTNDENLFEKISMISKHGQQGRYNYKTIGVNSRLDTLQAAVLISKLKFFEKEISMRNKVANIYNELLSSTNLIKIPSIPDQANRSVWAQYTIILDDKVYKKRQEIMAKMKEKNIPTALYYPAALHLQKPYFDSDAFLPITEYIADRVMSLPMHPYLEKVEIEYISDNLMKILDGLN
jgi:UDP-2-acetamido-2-deoxy-ribo-hexuluronate aminotransferase